MQSAHGFFGFSANYKIGLPIDQQSQTLAHDGMVIDHQDSFLGDRLVLRSMVLRSMALRSLILQRMVLRFGTHAHVSLRSFVPNRKQTGHHRSSSRDALHFE